MTAVVYDLELHKIIIIRAYVYIVMFELFDLVTWTSEACSRNVFIFSARSYLSHRFIMQPD